DKMWLAVAVLALALAAAGAACGGDDDAAITATRATTTAVDSAPATDVASVSFREGDLPGERVWQLPDAPGGYEPDQSWLAVGSDPDGNIYVSVTITC
ncbi:MAG: hypothetical protein OEO77_13095, partial [Acidimicrobiia bacterium]|nr:hypothetical protein [Acidimicrobiia bacterium]